ncbi:MAG: hypothetical protein H6696_14470 [Deferribacteres bacterium]|nr:hypothetical protein [Deferribacteres bacterium]
MKTNNLLINIGKTVGLLLLLPFFLFWDIKRFRYYMRKLRYAIKTGITCGNCGSQIPLVGMWSCSCGYQYTGNLFKVCPICGSLPDVVRCPHCGVTTIVH